MKFQVAPLNENFDTEHFISEGGLWEVGLWNVLFGKRVRLSKVGSCGCVLDYCAGDNLSFQYELLNAVMVVLLKVPEDAPEFFVGDMFPGYHVKPINRDPTCWLELQALRDKVLAEQMAVVPGAPVLPAPEWYRAKIEHLCRQPKPPLDRVIAQMQSTEPYPDRFTELGDKVS